MKKCLFLFLPITLLAACTTIKDWAAIGGSRADGIVVMAYTHSNMEMASADEKQALALAQTRCKAWGYRDAAAFGGETKKCTAPSYGGCYTWEVNRQYQCTGQPDK